MNSSSAVSNVLAATSVQAPKSTPIRNIPDDDTKSDFKRALNDAGADHDKAAQEPCVKRTTAADKRVKAKADDSATPVTDKTTPTSESNKSAITSAEPGAVKEGLSADKDSAALTDNALAFVDPALAAQMTGDLTPVLPSVVAPTNETAAPAIATTDTLLGAIEVDAAPTLPPAVPTSALESAITPASVNQALADMTVTTDTAVTETNIDVDAPLTSTLAATAEFTPAKIDPAVAATSTPVASALLTDAADATAPALNAIINAALPTDKTATSAEPDVEGTATTSANVGTLTTSSSATASVAAATAQVAEADPLVNSGIAVPTNINSKTDKPAVSTDMTASADTDATPSDPKAVFEKMLQNMTASNTATAGGEGRTLESLDRASALSPAATSAPAGLESLARGTESQAPAVRGFVVQTAVPVPVGQPQWSQAVGEKVLWLAAQNVHSADISLNPLDLGPVQVKISVNQEQITVNFTSHHPGVREVLDQNLGRLREMFSEQGLNLVNVDVSDKSFQRQQGDGSERQGQGGRTEVDDDETVVATSTIVSPRLVDHYA